MVFKLHLNSGKTTLILTAKWQGFLPKVNFQNFPALRPYETTEAFLIPGKTPAGSIALAADHAGYDLKEALKPHLTSLGVKFIDVGTNSAEERCDYPDFAELAALSILKRKSAFGILVCGSGIGMAIAANKFPGILAAVCSSPLDAGLARAHNCANVLTLRARPFDLETAQAIVTSFLSTPFESGRHEQRVGKMLNLG